MADPTDNQPPGGYYDPLSEVDEVVGFHDPLGEGGWDDLPDEGGWDDLPDEGVLYHDPLGVADMPEESEESVYSDPLQGTPSLYPSVSPEEESQALAALYNPTIGGLTERIRSPTFNTLTTIERDSLLEAYAGEMVKQGLYDEEEMLYISPELQEELGVSGVRWDPGATSYRPGSELLSPLSSTGERPLTLEEFMSDVGLEEGSREAAVLREKLRHIARRDDVFSPSGLGPGLEEQVGTIAGLLGQWFEEEETATLTEDPLLFFLKGWKQLGQFMTWKFAMMAGSASSLAQDVYNNINNLPTVPGELQDVGSRLTLTGLDAIGASESIKRLGLAADMGIDYGLGPTARRAQELQVMESHLKGSGIITPAIKETASLFYHLNRMTARTGLSTAEFLEMIPKWTELAEMVDPETGELLGKYTIMDLAQDHVRSKWKNAFELTAEGPPEAAVETPIGGLVYTPQGTVPSAILFARNMRDAFNRDVGFSPEERGLRAQLGAAGQVPQEVWGVEVGGKPPWSPDAPGMTPVPPGPPMSGDVRFAEYKNAQQQATDYWRNSTPDDSAKMDRYIRAELVRRDSSAVYTAAQNGLFGGAGRRSPEFFEAMYTSQLVQGEPIKRGMLALYGLQQLYFFGRQMPYNMAAAAVSAPLVLRDMSPEEIDSYADNISSALPMDMTKEEVVEMAHYGKERYIKEFVFSVFDMMVVGMAGNYGLKAGVAASQTGKFLRDPIPGLEKAVNDAVQEPLLEPIPEMPPHALPPIERRAQTIREAVAEVRNTELDLADMREAKGEPLTKVEKAAIKYGATSSQALAGLGALFTRSAYGSGRARNRQEALTRYMENRPRKEAKPLDVYEERNQPPGAATSLADPFGVGAQRLSPRIRAEMRESAGGEPHMPLPLEIGPWEEARRAARKPTEKGREDLERAQADGKKLINPDTGREFLPPPASRAGEGPAPLRPEVVVEGPTISRDKAREAAAGGDPAALEVVEAARKAVREDAAATVPITDRASRAREFILKTVEMGPAKALEAARRFVSKFYPSAPEAWMAEFSQAVEGRATSAAHLTKMGEFGELQGVSAKVKEARQLHETNLQIAEASLKKLLDDVITAPRGPAEPPASMGVGTVDRSVPPAAPAVTKTDKMTRDMLGTKVKTDAEGNSRVDVVEGGVGGIAEELGLFNRDGSIDLTNYVSTTPFLQRILNMAARGHGGRYLYEWLNNKHKKSPEGPGEALTEGQLTTAAGLSMERRETIRQSNSAAEAPSISIFPGKAERSVRHARDLYNEAVAGIAMREGVTPSAWLLINKVQEIAQYFVEMGISDPSVYQQISKGGHTVSRKQAMGLAKAGAMRAERPTVIPKDKFNAADALRPPGNKVSGDWMPREGERPYKAFGTEATMTPESRFSDKVRRGEPLSGDVELPIRSRYQFGTDERPAWARIASTFLDERGVEILRGAEDVKVLGHSLNPVQRGAYAVSEFMMRPFAIANTMWHVADFWGNRLRSAGRGGTGPTPDGHMEGFLWAMTGPNRKFGEPLANELLRATRTADSYADLVKGIVKVFDKKNVKMTEKDAVRLLRDLDMADGIDAVRADFSSRGKQILDGAQVQRWLDIVKRFEDTPITDPNGKTYTVHEFMEPYARYEGKWVKVEELNQRLIYNEITPEQYRLGTRDFSYRPKGDVAWGDLTGQQRSIMLIANELSRPLDRVFFDMSTQLMMSEHAMRLSLGKGDAFVVGEQLLKMDKGSLAEKSTNWMGDFFDSRANLTFVMKVYNSMIKAGATPVDIDGNFGALKLVDKQLGMIAPGGGKKSRETIGTKEFKDVFTKEVLRERLDKEGIKYDKGASREKLIDLQPDLGLSEIYGLLWESPNEVATKYFTEHFANGRQPSGIVERYYKSRIWDTQFNYQQKLEHGLWDIRESAVKAATELGGALAKQRLTVWMRQNGLILTHKEHLELVNQAVSDATSRGASRKEVEKARQRAQRLKDNMFRSQKAGYWELPSGKEGTFMVHKYADKYMAENAKMIEAGTKVFAKIHQAIKLGYVARTGTIIRNALSNYWIFGKMAVIPWIASGRWHDKAVADLKASASGGKVSQEYLALMREGGAQGGGYQRAEMTRSESLARIQLELLSDFNRAEGLGKPKNAQEAEKIVGAIFGVIEKKGGAGSKIHEIFDHIRLNDMRAPTGEWVEDAGRKKRTPLEHVATSGRRAKDWVTQKYGLVDEGAKLSYAYQLMMEHGYTAKQAHKVVNETFMAWDNVAPIINHIRNNFASVALAGPFIAFAVMALEKAHGMVAKNPQQAMMWANLLQACVSASSAAVGFERDDLMREMLLTGNIPLPIIANQFGKYVPWGDESGFAGTGVTGKVLARAEAGPAMLKGGLVNPISSYDLNQQSVRPKSLFGQVMGAISFLGSSPVVQGVNAFMDPISDPLAVNGSSPHERAGQEFWERTKGFFGPLMPGLPKDLLGVASGLQGGKEVFGVSRSLIEGISGPAGWSTTIMSTTKKAQLIAARLKAVGKDVTDRLKAARSQYDVAREHGLDTRDLDEQIGRLEAVQAELPHLEQQVTVAKVRSVLDNYSLWLPRLLATYSDDPFSSVMVEIEGAIGGAKPGTVRYKSVINKLDAATRYEWDRYVVRRDQAVLYQMAIGRKEVEYPPPPPPNPLWQ